MTQSEGKEMAVPSTGHRVREAQTTALADFASRWWAVALALATVIGAYFQLREEIATVRAEARETRNELQRLRFWLENPEKFPGRNAEGEPLDKGKIKHTAGDNFGRQIVAPGTKDAIEVVPQKPTQTVAPIKRDLGR